MLLHSFYVQSNYILGCLCHVSQKAGVWARLEKISYLAKLMLVQGLGELGKHKSRLEKEKEAAAAARKAAGGSPALGRLPSYMRPTSASKAMQKVISQILTICLDVSLTQSTKIAVCCVQAACLVCFQSWLHLWLHVLLYCSLTKGSCAYKQHVVC